MFTLSLPIAGIDLNALVLVAIGFSVGVLSGIFGMGGAWIVTPALNIFNFPMASAIGTDLAHIFGRSVVSTTKQGRVGNLDLKLGLFSIIGSIIGVEAGAQCIMWLTRLELAGLVVRIFYLVMLFGLGIYMLYDYLTQEKRLAQQSSSWRDPGAVAAPARKVWNIPPMINFPVSGITISFWTVFGVFFITGWLSGFIGVGGGFIRMPALIYLIGCSTAVAVGTDMFALLFTAAYGCFTYGLKGQVEIGAALLILVGGVLGAQIGTVAVKYVRGAAIRLLFAVMLILAGVAVILKQFHLGTPAAWLMMVAALGICLVIMVQLWVNYRRQQAERLDYRV